MGSIILWILVIIVIVAALAGYAVWKITVKAQNPRVVHNDSNPQAPHEEVSWKSGGETIRGWLLTHPREGTEPAPVIVVAHGWGSNRSRIMRYALPLHEAGFFVLTYDVRSHGESGPARALTGLTFRDDLLAALEWIRGRDDLDAASIGVLGHSVGGFGSVLALDVGAPIAALVTDAMPVRFDTMVEAELRRKGMPVFPLAMLIGATMLLRSGISRRFLNHSSPARILADNERGARVPVLLVHSRKDNFIPPSELEHVLAKAPHVKHLFVDAEGHSVSEQDPSFWREVLPFFRTHLHKKGGLQPQPQAREQLYK